MSFRYTRKDCQEQLERLAAALDKPIYDPERYPDPQIGSWRLDYNGVYGGYVIEEIYGDRWSAATGITMPLGYRRRNADTFVSTINFAIDCIELAIGREALQARMAPYYRAQAAKTPNYSGPRRTKKGA